MICARCGKPINELNDKWVHIVDFEKGEKMKEIDVHYSCWRLQFQENINKAFNDKAKQIFPTIKSMLGKMA